MFSNFIKFQQNMRYSRQNLLSGSTKSNEGFSHSPSPLVERSHNSLRQPTLPPGQSAAPKLNTDQTNTTENQNDNNQNENLPKRSATSIFPNPANSDGCAPDIINVNQNVLQNNAQQPNSNSDHSRISFLNAFSNNTISNLNSNQNVPDMVYSVNSPSRPLNNEVNFNIPLEANFKTKLLPKSSGANKKRARISNTQSVDDSEMMRNSSRRPVDERRDLNLSSDNLQREVKSTTKLFEELRENVYTEVAAFITLNETRPHFLIQLFRDLQQVSSDPLRQRTLLTIQEVVSQYLDVLQHQNRTGESQTNESNGTESYPNSECQIPPTAPKPTTTNVQQSDSTSQGEPSNEVHSSDPTNNDEARNSLPSASSCTSACTGIPSGDRVGTSSAAGPGCEAHACGSSVGALCNVLSVDSNNDSGIVADNVAQCSPRPRPNPLLLRFQTNTSTPNETVPKTLQQSEPPMSSIRHQNMNCSSTSTFDNQDRFESLPSMQQMGQCSSISPNSSPLWYAADDSSCSSGSHKPDDTLTTKPDNSSDLDTLFSPCSRGSEYRSRSLTTEDARTQSDAAIRFMPRYDLRAVPLADNGVRLDMSAPCNEDLAEADQVCGGGLDVAQLTAQESYNVTDGWSEHMEIDCDISGNMEPQTYEGENHTPQNSQYKDDDDIAGEAMGFGICISSPSPDVARVGPGGDMASEAEASWVLNMEQGLDRVPTRLSTGANGGASAPCSPSSPDNETDK